MELTEAKLIELGFNKSEKIKGVDLYYFSINDFVIIKKENVFEFAGFRINRFEQLQNIYFELKGQKL
jgi:hypothetical protein